MSNLLTIIIPTFNYAHVLAEAIQSAIDTIDLVGGTVVVVDDCSTDQTQKIISQFNKVKSISLNKRKGAAIARNIGVNESESEFLLFLDSDDVLIPESIEKHVDVLMNNNEVCCTYSDFLVCDEFLSPQSKWSDNRDISLKNQVDKLCWDSIIGMPSLTIKRSSFNEVGQFKNLPRCQDWDLAIRLMALKPLKYVDCLSHKRRVFEKLTWEKNLKERFENFMNVKNILENDIEFKKVFPKIHNKRFACIYRFLAEVSYQMKNYNEALYYTDCATGCVDFFKDASILKALVYLERKEYKKIIEILKKDHRSFFLRAYKKTELDLMFKSYLNLGDKKNAVQVLEKLHELTQNSNDIYKIAKLYEDIDDKQKALNWFGKLAELRSDQCVKYRLSGYYNMAKIYKSLSEKKKLSIMIKKCLEIEPNHQAIKRLA